jgi:hypothetical protein
MDARRSGLFDSAEDFFRLGGSVVMKLTPAAAVEVCKRAAERGFIIARIEGGIWEAPWFEARLDCIWDGADPPIDKDRAQKNNELAAQFIQREMRQHNAFILTAPPITGWPHKERTNAP